MWLICQCLLVSDFHVRTFYKGPHECQPAKTRFRAEKTHCFLGTLARVFLPRLKSKSLSKSRHFLLVGTPPGAGANGFSASRPNDRDAEIKPCVRSSTLRTTTSGHVRPPATPRAAWLGAPDIPAVPSARPPTSRGRAGHALSSETGHLACRICS